MEKKKSVTIAKLAYVFFFYDLLKNPFLETPSHSTLEMLCLKVVSTPAKKSKEKICLDRNCNCKRLNIGISRGCTLKRISVSKGVKLSQEFSLAT